MSKNQPQTKEYKNKINFNSVAKTARKDSISSERRKSVNSQDRNCYMFKIAKQFSNKKAKAAKCTSIKKINLYDLDNKSSTRDLRSSQSSNCFTKFFSSKSKGYQTARAKPPIDSRSKRRLKEESNRENGSKQKKVRNKDIVKFIKIK